MNEKNKLLTGSIGKTLIFFALPYLLSSFMQTFYGMADLFITGLYNGSATITAVSIGSQVMHMFTVILLGFAMGTTVRIGHAVGAGDGKAAARTMGTTAVFFIGFACVLTVTLFLLAGNIARVMLTPPEAESQTVAYLRICFLGIPFITAYNVISSLFRGAGDSRSPMYFVAVACVVNIVLDFAFIGLLGMGAAGAALGTVCGQAVSVLTALSMLRKKDFGFAMNRQTMKPSRQLLSDILKVGAPIALQDGLIQVAFVVITIIANSRGLIAAASVGIVEKLIGFMFLVPSSFLSAISAVTAQNMGAGKPERARKSLYYGLMITVGWGILCCLYNQVLPHTLIGLFTKEEAVLAAGQNQDHLHGLQPAAGAAVGGQGQRHAGVQHGTGIEGAIVLDREVDSGQHHAHHAGVPQFGEHMLRGVVQMDRRGHLHLCGHCIHINGRFHCIADILFMVQLY